MTDIDRRRFLKRPAALATLAAANPALGDDEGKKAGPNEVIRVAVIGLGGRGGEHLRGFSNRKDARITTLCDVDASHLAAATKYAKFDSEPKCVDDLRRVLDDKDVDAVSIATPNHWHALATIWACQAGKDAYVEKPASHDVVEGRRMVEAARKYGRIVQVGTQCRSHKGIQDAVAFLRSGGIGKVYMAKGLCYKRRDSIGHQDDGPVPEGVDYDLWCGPAEARPFNANRFHYNWHWFWNTGNGDLGNQGVHQMDIARWGLGKSEFPAPSTPPAAGSATRTTARRPTPRPSRWSSTTPCSSSRSGASPPTPRPGHTSACSSTARKASCRSPATPTGRATSAPTARRAPAAGVAATTSAISSRP